jgi:hypothetical protein
MCICVLCSTPPTVNRSPGWPGWQYYALADHPAAAKRKHCLAKLRKGSHANFTNTVRHTLLWHMAGTHDSHTLKRTHIMHGAKTSQATQTTQSQAILQLSNTGTVPTGMQRLQVSVVPARLLRLKSSEYPHAMARC